MPPGSVALSESGSETSTRTYAPGPHAGSDSGQVMDTACHEPGERTRPAPPARETAFARPPVLSMTFWSGKPVAEGVCEGVGVIDDDGVCEREMVCEAVVAGVLLGVPLRVGEPEGVARGLGDGVAEADGAHESFTPRSCSAG